MDSSNSGFTPSALRVGIGITISIEQPRIAPAQVKVDPHREQKPRHRPGDELSLVISPLVT
jgi:hypothetical protein